MSARRSAVRVLAAVALVVPLLGACGVNTQNAPERIPAGGLPAELRASHTEPVPVLAEARPGSGALGRMGDATVASG